MDKYIFLGVGAYVVVVHEILFYQYRERNCLFKILGFIDSDEEKHNKTFFGYPVLGNIEWLKVQRDIINIVSFVNPKARKELIEPIKNMDNFIFPNIIHPTAIISKSAIIGQGNIIGQNVVIASEVHIGNFNHLNYSVNIGHNCKLSNYITCNGGAGIYGSSVIEDNVFIGPGAVVFDQVRVGKSAKVGANAVVRKDVPEKVTVVGVPARVIKKAE